MFRGKLAGLLSREFSETKVGQLEPPVDPDDVVRLEISMPPGIVSHLWYRSLRSGGPKVYVPAELIHMSVLTDDA